MKSFRQSDDPGRSDHQKLPSIAEIIQADPYPARHSLSTPSASSSPGPSPIKVEDDAPLPQPIRPQLSLPHRFRGSSSELSHPRARTLTFTPATQARHQHALDRYPDNQTYKDKLGQANQKIALKQHTIRVNPARLPQEHEVSDMFEYLERVKQLLQQVGPPQTSPRPQPGLHPPQQHMIGMPSPMTIPTNASEGVPKPDLVSRHLTEVVTCLTVNSPGFFQHGVAIVVDVLLAHRDSDRIGDRLCAEVVILIKQRRELSEALDVIGHSEALGTQISIAKIWRAGSQTFYEKCDSFL